MRIVVIGIALALTANPAAAQFGKIMKGVEKAQQVRDLRISEQDERALGEAVSDRVRLEFGVFQDKEVTKYVTLVGTVMAQASSRPDLNWEFIVLDTDGVNAFASPGGIGHITRGALGLTKSEAELAGVLAHEIAHITKKHTVNSIQKNKGFKLASDAVPGSNAYVGALANAAYDNIVEKGFDRGDEEDADEEGARLANKVGYNPAGLGTFLEKLNARNKGVLTRNALFASHPETEGRISRLGRQIKSEKLASTALVESRYTGTIKFDAKPITEISTVASGARGLAEGSGSQAKPEEKKEEQPKKKGFGLGRLGLSSGKEAQSTQASASAGNRAIGADRDAKGGGNPSKVSVTVTPAEVEAFKKGIAG
jgi:Zn-dependent protease with chaperone function